LLTIEHSPVAALNRAFAISKVRGKEAGIKEAEKLDLPDNQFYHSLLGNLYSRVDNLKALSHYRNALMLASSAADKATIQKNIREVECIQEKKAL